MVAVGLSASQQQFVRRGRRLAHGGGGKFLGTRVESKKGDRREGEAYDRRWTKDACWRERRQPKWAAPGFCASSDAAGRDRGDERQGDPKGDLLAVPNFRPSFGCGRWWRRDRIEGECVKVSEGESRGEQRVSGRVSRF